MGSLLGFVKCSPSSALSRSMDSTCQGRMLTNIRQAAAPGNSVALSVDGEGFPALCESGSPGFSDSGNSELQDVGVTRSLGNHFMCFRGTVA